MSHLIALVLAVLFAFSFKMVDITVSFTFGKVLYQQVKNEIVYIWGIVLAVIVYFYKDNYAFRLPIDYESTVLLVLVALITIIFISRYSGYKPIGKKNIFNFVIIYPIFEEMAFRGTIIPILNSSFEPCPLFEIFNLPVTVPIIISSFLFSVSHLQYYTFNKASMNYMIFAFCGGVIFGVITDYTLSIAISILLHVEFNLLSVYYSSKATAKRA